MKIIHIVASINRINFGVWNAAIFGSRYLKEKYDVDSELWICKKSNTPEINPDIRYFFFLKEDLSRNGFNTWLSQFDDKNTVIVSHGAWLLPTRLGYMAHKKGFKWVTLPHGMHEPWQSNSGIGKKLYYHLIERPRIQSADIVRAVSDKEKKNLEFQLKRPVYTVYNGVLMNDYNVVEKSETRKKYLFMARLQHKKGILHLVKAWVQTMYKQEDAELLIAGPDEGELIKIEPFIKNNIKYLGPVYGSEKEKLLREAHYYILPSYSEGFPTSIVEAMSFGAIPIISEGCNFPQVFEEEIGYQVKPDEESIKTVFNILREQTFDKALSAKNIQFIWNNFTDKKIGEDLYQMYSSLKNN